MPTIFKIKRRTSDGNAPTALKQGELAYNEVSNILYIGEGNDGGGNATSIVAIGGSGAFVSSVGGHTHAISDVISLQAALDAKVPTSRTISNGSGITGGGDLSANRTLAVDNTVVRTTGAQSIAGVKTHSDDILIGTINYSFASTSGIQLDAVGADNNGVLRVKTWATTANTQPVIVATQGLSDRFVVSANGNVTNQNNSYGGISDGTLKKNIEPVSPQLADIRLVDIVRYHLNEQDDSEEKLLGVIAQQLQKIMPGMVEVDLVTGKLRVKYSLFVPKLIKSLQELADKVDALEAKISQT